MPIKLFIFFSVDQSKYTHFICFLQTPTFSSHLLNSGRWVGDQKNKNTHTKKDSPGSDSFKPTRDSTSSIVLPWKKKDCNTN